MITTPIVVDFARLATQEARSALPDAPVQADQSRAPRGRVIPAIRLQMTNALRRIADALEPAPAEPATAGPNSGC